MNVKTNEPTDAALRAARAVSNELHAKKVWRTWEMAQIIDRETGLPDLIAACEEIVEHDIDDWTARMKTVRAALAKAKGGVA